MLKEGKVIVTTKEKGKLKKSVNEILVNEKNYQEVVELGRSYLFEKVHMKKIRGLRDLVNTSIAFNSVLFTTSISALIGAYTGNVAFLGASAVIGVAGTTKLLFNKIKLGEKQEEVENAVVDIYSLALENGWKSNNKTKSNKNIKVVDFKYEEKLINKAEEVESITLTDKSNNKVLSNSDKIDNLRKARRELVELKNIPHVKSAVYTKKI